MRRRISSIALSWVGDPWHALLALTCMTALLVASLIFAVVGWTNARNALGQVTAAETARVAEQRAKIRSDYALCLAGIDASRKVNRLLQDFRTDYLERAKTSEELAKLDPRGSAVRALRLRTARELRVRASHVPIFPVRTKRYCQNNLEDSIKKVPRVK